MTREELIQFLTLLKEQARNSGANTFVWDVKIDSFNFVIDSVIKALAQEPTTKNDLGVDCISRQAVLEGIAEWIADGYADSEADCSHISSLVTHLPSVTPQEPKTGYWVGIDEEPHEDYECNNCGYTISTYTANIEPHTEYKYCPNCGCRMIEPQEREEE